MTRSTYAAESHELCDTLELGKLLAMALVEIAGPKMTPMQLNQLEESGKWPMAVEACIDARSVFESVAQSEVKTPNEESLVVLLLALKEALSCGRLTRLWWIDTRDMIADAMNKGIIARRAVIETAQGSWQLHHRMAETHCPGGVHDISVCADLQ